MSKKSNPDSLVCLRVFESNFTANLALTKLRDANIPAQLDGAVWPGVLGVGTFGGGGYRLMIFERDREQAIPLICDIPD